MSDDGDFSIIQDDDDEIHDVISDINEIEDDVEIQEVEENDINDDDVISMDQDDEILIVDSTIPHIPYDIFFENLMRFERIIAQSEQTKTSIVSNEILGISLGYFFDDDSVFDHERIPLDLSYYGFDLTTASRKDKRTIIVMLQLLAWVYRKVSGIPEYSNIRYMAFKLNSKKHVNFVHGSTQAGKTALITMLSVFYSLSFGCITFVSVKNKDGDASITQFSKKITSTGFEDEIPNISMPVDVIKSILHTFMVNFEEHEDQFSNGTTFNTFIPFLLFFRNF